MGEELLGALRLGIGVHHAGLHTSYRRAVETLFRAKVLQVRLLRDVSSPQFCGLQHGCGHMSRPCQLYTFFSPTLICTFTACERRWHPLASPILRGDSNILLPSER